MSEGSKSTTTQGEAVDPASALFGLTTAGKTPHKCPICEGHGMVTGVFFHVAAGTGCWSKATVSDTCRPCGGTGIIYT